MKTPQNCIFYHTFDDIKGWWNLKDIKSYTGKFNFEGKSVLEIGPASGFVTQYMESQGASVTCVDLGPNLPPEHLPWYDMEVNEDEDKKEMEGINNSFYYVKERYSLKAELVHSSVYSIPKSIDKKDVSVLGCVLLHLSDPFKALQSVVAKTKNTIIVVEPMWRLQCLQRMSFWVLKSLGSLAGIPLKPAFFVPSVKGHWPSSYSWWYLPPDAVASMLEILGFIETKVVYHTQEFKGKTKPLYTIVASRTSLAQNLQYNESETKKKESINES